MKKMENILKNIIRDWRGYLLAVVLVAAATWVKWLAQPNIIPAVVPISYMLAIVPTALFFGLGPSILVCILSVLAYDFVFLSEPFSFSLLDTSNAPILIIFLFVGVTFSLLSSNLRNKNLVASKEIASRKQIEAELVKNKAQLEQTVKQRTSALEIANQKLSKEVSQRKTAQEELEKEKNYIQDILDTAQTIILALDTEGRILYFNPYMQDISGYAIEEVIGKDWFETFLPEKDRRATRQLFLSTLRNMRTHGVDNPIVTKDGRERLIEWSNTTFTDSNGTVLGVLASGKDSTERHKVEQTLAKTREQLEQDHRRLETILSTIPAAVMVTETATMRVSLINQRALELLGTNYSGAGINDILATVRALKPDGSAYPPEEIPVMRSLKSGEYIHNVEMSIERHDGTRIPVIVSSTPLFDSGGHVSAAIVIFDDITELKNAATVLMEEKDKARQYWNLAGTMLVAIDANAIVTDVNKKACEVMEYDRNEIIGKNWFDTFIPESTRDYMKTMFREIATGSIDAFKPNEITSVLTKSGEERTVSWYNSIIRDKNRMFAGTLSSGEDITNRKKIEEELQKIEKLDSIGTLAGGIAHDFNNILTAILGNISFALEQDTHNPQLLAALQEAEKASLRAQKLTQQLLTFSRGGAPVKKTISLVALIEEASSFALRGSKVKPEYSIMPDLWAVEADEGQINQVIHNLVKNAVEAMPEGGVIRINAENDTVDENRNLMLSPGKYVRIDIIDSGTGISDKYLDRMFEPFFTTKAKGSGLGLATSYSIIKNHGGYINLESEEGRGTTFHVYLPATEKRAIVKKDKPAHRIIKGKGKILIMDDEEMIRTMLATVLKLAGYRSVLVNDGAEAVRQYVDAAASGEPFDAVIMDLTIPGGMGGKDAVKKLLEQDPDVKVIVSSGYANDPIMAEYKKYGFSAVVTKPYAADKIGKTLRSLLKKKKTAGN